MESAKPLLSPKPIDQLNWIQATWNAVFINTSSSFCLSFFSIFQSHISFSININWIGRQCTKMQKSGRVKSHWFFYDFFVSFQWKTSREHTSAVSKGLPFAQATKLVLLWRCRDTQKFLTAEINKFIHIFLHWETLIHSNILLSIHNSILIFFHLSLFKTSLLYIP